MVIASRSSRRFVLLPLVFCATAVFAQNSQPPANQERRFKGIWEPVSYQADLKLLDVFFATPDEGWVSGGTDEAKGGIILHTSDGGDHWEVQYGDAGSSESAVRELRFIDPTHGWAVQRSGATARLFHTADGQNWIQAGTIDPHNRDYMFTSENAGVVLGSGRGAMDQISITADGGRTWQPVFDCATTLQAGGLSHHVKCQFSRLQFLSPSLGYAVAFSFDKAADGTIFLAKTTDGGNSWNWVNTGRLMEKGQASDVFFIDENTGYVRVGFPDSGQLFKTVDGGQSWTGMATSPGSRIQFADPEVGWAVLFNNLSFASARTKVSFTTDSGQRWNSREYPFPTRTAAFSIPRRDRGYVVGEHGMIYRYRIVPEEYTRAGMIAAPLLSGINSPLDHDVQAFALQVHELARNAGVDVNQGIAAQGSGPAAALATSPAPASGTPATAAAPAPVSAMPPAVSAGTTTSSGDSFTQNTNARVNSAGFTQAVSTAQQTLTTVAADAANFAQKYRSLNLLMAGVQAAVQVPGQIRDLKQGLAQLKQTKDASAASAALTNLLSGVGSLVQSTRLAFLKK